MPRGRHAEFVRENNGTRTIPDRGRSDDNTPVASNHSHPRLWQCRRSTTTRPCAGRSSPRDVATVDLRPSCADHSDVSSSQSIRYFGDYEIIREIARGGMGVVFQARQVSLNRRVALKMILAGQLADDDAIRRFHIEAEAAANLDHPGIVPIYEVGQHEGQHYFSMGFVEGESLSQRSAAGPLPAREAADLIRRVSRGHRLRPRARSDSPRPEAGQYLARPERQPARHRLRPGQEGRGRQRATGSGQIMGTPSYMPPEQAGGKRGEVGPAADVYALGATLYALVTGRPPFQAATAMDTLFQVVSEEPVPPRGSTQRSRATSIRFA